MLNLNIFYRLVEILKRCLYLVNTNNYKCIESIEYNDFLKNNIKASFLTDLLIFSGAAISSFFFVLINDFFFKDFDDEFFTRNISGVYVLPVFDEQKLLKDINNKVSVESFESDESYDFSAYDNWEEERIKDRNITDDNIIITNIDNVISTIVSTVTNTNTNTNTNTITVIEQKQIFKCPDSIFIDEELMRSLGYYNEVVYKEIIMNNLDNDIKNDVIEQKQIFKCPDSIFINEELMRSLGYYNEVVYKKIIMNNLDNDIKNDVIVLSEMMTEGLLLVRKGYMEYNDLINCLMHPEYNVLIKEWVDNCAIKEALRMINNEPKNVFIANDLSNYIRSLGFSERYTYFSVEKNLRKIGLL